MHDAASTSASTGWATTRSPSSTAGRRWRRRRPRTSTRSRAGAAPARSITVGRGHRPGVRHRRVRHPRLRPAGGAPRPRRPGGDGDRHGRSRRRPRVPRQLRHRRLARDRRPPRGPRPVLARRPTRSPTRSNETLGPARRDVRPASHGRAPGRARDPHRRRHALSANVTNTDPAYRREGHLGVALETFEPRGRARRAARGLRRCRGAPPTSRTRSSRGRRRSSTRPRSTRAAGRRGQLAGNLILTRDGGDHLPRLQPIAERFGMPWGCFVEMPVERGIAIALGMEPVDAPRLDADGLRARRPRSAYADWASLAAEALGGFQALYIHIKGPDVPAHDGRALDKRDVDRARSTGRSSARCCRGSISRTVVAVTADHATSCVRKAHTADPVPAARQRRSRSARRHRTSFGERACRGRLARPLLGPQILPRLTSIAGPARTRNPGGRIVVYSCGRFRRSLIGFGRGGTGYDRCSSC